MTNELQRAMARCEEARVRYRKAVLASLDGASNGDVIRQAIREYQRACAELKRLSPPAPPPAQAGPAPEVRAEPAEALASAWSSLRRAVSGFGARLPDRVLELVPLRSNRLLHR
jgi:hypothetical protein